MFTNDKMSKIDEARLKRTVQAVFDKHDAEARDQNLPVEEANWNAFKELQQLIAGQDRGPGLIRTMMDWGLLEPEDEV